MNIETALMLLPGLVIGLTFHEAAHAITAKWLGDRTAEKMGRVSLNPFRHLSPLGTLALFFIGFGWGKPVIVNLYNFKKPKLYYLLSSLAGPVMNLILSAVALGVLYLRPPDLIAWICMSVFMINALLAVFNLLPVPPLDGSKIWPCLIPGMRPAVSDKWTRIWMIVLILCLFTGVIDRILGPVFGALYSLLPAV
jgi:Zn-dependent protease